MRITVKGQVTIPQSIRDAAGFHPGTEIDFVLGDDGQVRVVPSEQLRGERRDRVMAAVERLRGSADAGLSTAQIMALTRE